MTNSNKSNKLVAAATTTQTTNTNKKRKWTETYSRVVAEVKVCAKFKKQLQKHNKGLTKDKQISQVKAATEALKMWMEKNSV